LSLNRFKKLENFLKIWQRTTKCYPFHIFLWCWWNFKNLHCRWKMFVKWSQRQPFLWTIFLIYWQLNCHEREHTWTQSSLFKRQWKSCSRSQWFKISINKSKNENEMQKHNFKLLMKSSLIGVQMWKEFTSNWNNPWSPSISSWDWLWFNLFAQKKMLTSNFLDLNDSCYSFALSLSKSLDSLPHELMNFIFKIHAYFCSAQRVARLQEIQNENNMNVLGLKKFVEVRRLSLDECLKAPWNVAIFIPLYWTRRIISGRSKKDKIKK